MLTEVIVSESPRIVMIHGDCMEYMATLKPKAFELAIVDPPYGINMDKGFSGFSGFGGFGKPIARRQYIGHWDSSRPNQHYTQALLNASTISIVWGGNYLSDILPQSKHWIVWDKKNTMPTFSDCELAWTNCSKSSVKKVEIEYNGLIGKEPQPRMHPTQKPVKLYKWLLKNYAKEGDKILDTHGGSFSSAIACYDMGFDFVGIEKDVEYFEKALDRVQRHIRQERLELV